MMGAIKIYRNGIMLLCVMILVVCCKKEATTRSETENTTVVFKDATVQQVYVQYLNIKAALVASTPQKAQEETKILATLLPDTKTYTALKATTQLLYLTKDLTKQREFFVGLTLGIESIIRQTDIESGAVYKQFCPMAFDGIGGYWLSDTEDIRNPFFGDQMLHCGRVDEIIK